MLWSIDIWQNRVSADQYYLTFPWAQVSTHRGGVFFEVIRWQITSFKWSHAQVYFFKWFIWNICLCHYGPALLRFWFQTDLAAKIQPFSQQYRRGKSILTMVTRWSRSTSKFSSDWSTFARWVHAENLCSILKVAYFDSWSGTEFCVSLWCF